MDDVFQLDLFLLDQPLCSHWYKMYACHITHHQRQNRAGEEAMIVKRTIMITARTGRSGTRAITRKRLKRSMRRQS